MPPAEAYGVASFYTMFSMKPRPPSVVHVCDDIACRVNGAEALCRDLTLRLGNAGEPALDGRAMWLRSPCLGQCDRAPAALFQLAGRERSDWTLIGATADAIVAGLGGGVRDRGTRAAVYADQPRLLRRVGAADPERLDNYRAHGGYDALRRAFALGPDRVIREVTDSRLVAARRALPDRTKVGRGRSRVRAPALLRAMPTSRSPALLGSGADGRGPVRGARSDDHRRVRDGCEQGCTFAASIRCGGTARRRHRPGADPGPPRRRRDGRARAVRRAAGAGVTSAERRRLQLHRSAAEEQAAVPGTVGPSASRPWSTTSRRS